MFCSHLLNSEIGGTGLRGAAHHDVAPVSINVKLYIDKRDQFRNAARDGDVGSEPRCRDDTLAQCLLCPVVLNQKCGGIGLVAFTSLDDFDTLAHITDGMYIYT